MGCDVHIHIGRPPILYRNPYPIALFCEYEIDTDKALKQPHIWVGEASFLKAGLTGDIDRYVPQPIQKICKLIPDSCSGKSVIIDDKLIETIEEIDWTNNTQYEICEKKKLIEFLKKHKGKECYYICW